MGGISATSFMVTGSIVAVGIVVVTVMVLLSVAKGKAHKALVHVLPVALIQFIDFAFDLLVLFEFYRLGLMEYFQIGFSFVCLSTLMPASLIFVRGRSLEWSSPEQLICMLLCVVNLHMLFVGISSVGANVEYDDKMANADDGKERHAEAEAEAEETADAATKRLSEKDYQQHCEEAQRTYGRTPPRKLREAYEAKSLEGAAPGQKSPLLL